MIRFSKNQWALILGGSSGFGLATADRLAADGMSVCVVHRDRRGAMDRIEREFERIRKHGQSFFSLNLDALSVDGVRATLEILREKMGADGKVDVLLHSIAYGNLKPVSMLEEEDVSRTIYAMGTSLLTWVQALQTHSMFAAKARILGLTSEGNSVAWPSYAAVSAAKSALESISRAIAVEFGRFGLRSNVIQAGVTDTPALRLIPGNEKMLEQALARNPFGRLTLPQDVANVIALLCSSDADWINGVVLRVDGGEHIAAP